MKKPLRILLVEDSRTDAELIEHEVRTAYEPTVARVQDPDALSRALQSAAWDIVVSDYYMPAFTGLDALRMVRESGIDLPFIMVSGNAGEDFAVEAMRAGAHDDVM